MPEPEKYDYDVFISYSSRNKQWVRKELHKRIEKAGLRACIDFRDFTRGMPSIVAMENAVVKSRKALVVLTPEYVESQWAEIENIMVQTLSPANRDLRLIPMLKAECKKPLRIGALTHIDFTDGADLKLAWRQLLTALGAPPEPTLPAQPQRRRWLLAHAYPMSSNFTGRLAERAMLSRWLKEEDGPHRLLVLRALGGFGKSALVWHWLMHDVAPADWSRVVWWSFYEGDASFDNFLARTVQYLTGKPPKTQPLSTREQLETLQQQLRQPGTLLVLDGFERALRAFGGLDAAYRGDDAATSETNERDCISPLADRFLRNVAALPEIRAKVLLTTRLTPRALEAKGGGLLQGAREEILRQMAPADAVVFFRAQGIRGTHTEIEQACDPYGYHPLSLRLLAGLIVNDFQQPGDIAAARRMDVSGDLIQSQHHVLKAAYDSLTPSRQTLLGRITCFRSSVGYDALKALAETPGGGAALDSDLRDLLARGLLHHDTKERRFDVHPIVRRYAYDRLTALDRTAAHIRLRDHFAAVPVPQKVTRLEDLAPVIELYHHTVRAGQYDEARELYYDRMWNATYYQLGAYQLQIDFLSALFPDREDHPPRLKGESDQAWTLNALANSYSISGQPHRAVGLLEQAKANYEKIGNKGHLAVGVGNLALNQLKIGALRAAEANLRRTIALGREIKDEFKEPVGHRELGRLLGCRGEWADSEAELETALTMFEKRAYVAGQGLVWAYRALRALLLVRLPSGSSLVTRHSPLEAARRALELADEWGRAAYPLERDYVRAHWLLGAAHRVANECDEAESHLHEALERCRRINLVETEADILIDLARLRASTGAADEAQRLAEEALMITDRSGYVLQGADAHLELAKLALARGDKATAREHATEARRLATCDGPPDYTYKVAYDEAGELLDQ
jgi:tetratricopeptide (TPR) repeat protein